MTMSGQADRQDENTLAAEIAQLREVCEWWQPVPNAYSTALERVEGRMRDLETALTQALAEIETTPYHSNSWGWGIAYRIDKWRAALVGAEAAEATSPEAACYCGSLEWTKGQYGRITHKHACPARTDDRCQTHPAMCPAEATTEATDAR